MQRFDPAARRLVDAEWPPALAGVQRRLAEAAADDRGDGQPFRGPMGPVDDEAPALLVPVPAAGDAPGGSPRPFRAAGLTIVLLDRDYITHELLPGLAARYFAGGGELDYFVVVTRRRDPGGVVYRSDPEAAAREAPDATASLFEVRFDEIPGGRLGVYAPSLLNRRPPREPRRFAARGRRRDFGAWEVGVTHRAGSLETLVARARRRNLAISFGSLLLLGTSAVMIVLSCQRARRLAAQRVEFVAGVSHELRTPVAVVCSAGENLADGLVRDPAEVRLYGRTIRDEGRRLADMVEQVLDFAGISARDRRPLREAVDVAGLVRDVLAASSPAIGERAVRVETHLPPGLAVNGDPAALRRAVQNLVLNAVKYGGEARWLSVSAEAAGAARRRVVRLTVADRGLGVPREEERRIFEPFYRGRAAREAGIAGSGLGLSLVRHIAEAHGGAVEVRSGEGEGSAFTLVLPCVPVPAPAEDVLEEGRVQTHPGR